MRITKELEERMKKNREDWWRRVTSRPAILEEQMRENREARRKRLSEKSINNL